MPREEKKKQFSLSLMMRIFLAVIVVVSLAVFVNSVMKYNELRTEEQELEQVFKLTDPEGPVYRCLYCETRASLNK